MPEGVIPLVEGREKNRSALLGSQRTMLCNISAQGALAIEGIEECCGVRRAYAETLGARKERRRGAEVGF